MSSVLMLAVLSAWPGPDAVLTPPAPVVRHSPLRVYVDAGHGAPGNEGNHGCRCQLEQDHTLAVSQHLAFVLADLGFTVKLSRSGADRPPYKARIADAEAWKADVIVSLHSDARGEATLWRPFPGEITECFRNVDEPGFAVLWSDVATPKVVERRTRLGRLMGQWLRQTGFLAYSGINYGALYRQDPEEPAGWIDIRPPGKSVYFLHTSEVPTVIIETHHALDPVEVARWDELKTVDAFALTVAAALDEFSPNPSKSQAIPRK